MTAFNEEFTYNLNNIRVLLPTASLLSHSQFNSRLGSAAQSLNSRVALPAEIESTTDTRRV